MSQIWQQHTGKQIGKQKNTKVPNRSVRNFGEKLEINVTFQMKKRFYISCFSKTSWIFINTWVSLSVLTVHHHRTIKCLFQAALVWFLQIKCRVRSVRSHCSCSWNRLASKAWTVRGLGINCKVKRLFSGLLFIPVWQSYKQKEEIHWSQSNNC